MIPLRRLEIRQLRCEPRMRGDDPSTIYRQCKSTYVSPACAGMIPARKYLTQKMQGEPRMRGDDPLPILKAFGKGT